MKTLIRGATVVTPHETLVTSVLVDGSLIADIDVAPQITADETVDAAGLYLLPGVIDDQVHFREPGLTHKEDLRHASRACAKGGVTTFLEMPNTKPTTTSQSALLDKLALASRVSLVNYGFYIGATLDNLDELRSADRTPGIKIFIGSSTGNMLVDDQTALERIFAETTLPITAHCEDESTVIANRQKHQHITDVRVHSMIRDHSAAIVATRRSVDLAIRHNHPFHVLHVSTGAEADFLAETKSLHGDLITAEVCPHHLFFNIDDYDRLGSLIQMNPSVKTQADNQRLWRALQEGTIDLIATDHAPHTLAEKQQPYPASPSGLPAVENSLALLLDQVHQSRCSIEQVVQWMSQRPAEVWRIKNKGRIEVGWDADLVLVDLESSQKVLNNLQQTKCRWSPWHGQTLTGWPLRTWVLGHEVFREGKFDESRMGREAEYR